MSAKGPIARSHDTDLRLLQVIPQAAPVPPDELQEPAAWQIAGPAVTASFAAPCYFMGAALRQRQRVPIGLIAAAWGGTGINAWRDEQSFKDVGDEADGLALLKRYARNRERGIEGWARVWESWWRSRRGDKEGQEPWRSSSADWEAVPALAPWETWGKGELATFDGMLWYRSEVVLTGEQASNAVAVELGHADDIDTTWFNGILVGTTALNDVTRRYPIRGAREGINLVVSNVRDLADRGGLIGPSPAILLRDGGRVPLMKWSYEKVPAEVGRSPRAPWDARGGLSVAYNGMIAPLGPLELAGVAWYQGEAETLPALTRGYAEKLISLKRRWRRQFGRSDLPFLVVQLPEYRERRSSPGPSAWADIRNQQRLATEGDAAAALVPTIGLGSEHDVHPADKAEVGRRLAAAAERLNAETRTAPRGASSAVATRSTGWIQVRLGAGSGRLTSYGSPRVFGFELCGLTDETCRFVDAHIVDGTAVAIEDDPTARRVRYGWADHPAGNLAEASGMLVGSFELAVAKQ